MFSSDSVDKKYSQEAGFLHHMHSLQNSEELHSKGALASSGINSLLTTHNIITVFIVIWILRRNAIPENKIICTHKWENTTNF